MVLLWFDWDEESKEREEGSPTGKERRENGASDCCDWCVL